MKRPIISTTIRGTTNSGKTTALLQQMGDILQEYEDKKVLIIVCEESAAATMARIQQLGYADHPNLDIVEYNQDSKNPASWGSSLGELYRWIYERQCDVLAVDDNVELMNYIMAQDKDEGGVNRHYFKTANERVVRRPVMSDNHIPDYSLGA